METQLLKISKHVANKRSQIRRCLGFEMSRVEGKTRLSANQKDVWIKLPASQMARFWRNSSVSPRERSAYANTCAHALPDCSGIKAFTWQRNSNYSHVIQVAQPGFTDSNWSLKTPIVLRRRC